MPWPLAVVWGFIGLTVTSKLIVDHLGATVGVNMLNGGVILALMCVPIITSIAEDTGLSRKQVADVFLSMNNLVTRHIQKRGSGEFTIPDLGVKIRRVQKPRTKARMGRNPATGEAIKIPAKPATTVVKVAALKALKDKLS